MPAKGAYDLKLAYEKPLLAYEKPLLAFGDGF